MSDGLLMGHSVDGADEDAEWEDEDIETDLPVEIAPKAKRKWSVNEQDNKSLIKKLLVDEKKPTVPHAGKSAPAEPFVRKKARTGIEHFADIAAREEETTQKALELKQTKFKGETEKAVTKVRAQAEIQMNKDRLRMEYAQKKLELEFKFRLQAQAAQQPSSQFGGHGRPAANIYPTAQTSFPGTFGTL